MNTEATGSGRRVPARYSAEDREKLIKEHAASGLTKKAYCQRLGISLGTFYDWSKSRKKQVKGKASAKFAEVEVNLQAAAVEILLPNGTRIGIRHTGNPSELISLVRGVAGC